MVNDERAGITVRFLQPGPFRGNRDSREAGATRHHPTVRLNLSAMTFITMR
jgi:hypothetical protein